MEHSKHKRNQVAEMCVFAPDSGEYYQPLDDEIRTCSSQNLHIASAFRHNLAAASSTVTLPFTLVSTGIYNARLHSLHLAEIFREKARLVGAGMDDTIDESREQELATLARQRLQEEIRSNPELCGNQIFDVLGSHLQNDDFAKVARELLRQGTVLLWRAVEVLIRDLHAETVGLEMKGVKSALKALLRAEGDQESLMKNLGILALFQERHLIVHCRSIVDAKFIEATGENLVAGSELVIKVERIEQRFQEARGAGIQILQAVRLLG